MMKLILLVVSLSYSFSSVFAFEQPTESCVTNFLQKYEETAPFKYNPKAYYARKVMQKIRNYPDSPDWKDKIKKSIRRATQSVNTLINFDNEPGQKVEKKQIDNEEVDDYQENDDSTAELNSAIQDYAEKRRRRETKMTFPTPTNIMRELFSREANFVEGTDGKFIPIPMGMKYLAMVETSLDPMPIGSAYERGIWQFRPRIAEVCGGLTVREFHLNDSCNTDLYQKCLRCRTPKTPDDYIGCTKCYLCKKPYDATKDERIDIKKSTQGFIKCSRWLWNMFHDWELVVAGWNSGNTVLCRLLREKRYSKLKCEYLEDLLDEIDNPLHEIWNVIVRTDTGKIRAQLPTITKEYVSKFYATAFLYNYVQNPRLCEIFDRD